MPTLTLRTPADFELARDACSYGYFLLHPNHWDPRRKAFSRVVSLPGGPVAVQITQPRGTGGTLAIATSRTLRATDRAALERQVARMFRLDEDENLITAFHRADKRWKKSGRGRLFRSPTMFEDVIKTVTSCNVTWPSTVHMNRRLCEVLNGAAVPERSRPAWPSVHPFPTPSQLARTRPQTLRARCRVGYRDQRIIELSCLFTLPRSRGGLDPEWFEDPATTDQEVHDALIELPGIGPYAAANVMQLLGRYSRLPLDTESVRHGRTVLGYKGSPARIMKKIHAHYAPFGAHAFRSYWFELWAFYERKAGPSTTWERDSTGKVFTAAMLNG